MRVFLASKNPDKLRELRQIFTGSEIELESFADYRDVEEGEISYVENADVKARSLFEQLQEAGIEAATLADDSGIEVDALDGRPGVLSARYAGDVSWPQRLDMLLKEAAASDGRRRGCRFVCWIAMVLPDGAWVRGYGGVAGELAPQPLGSNGFGYDPIFYYPPLQKTFGELSEAQKNRLSHRYNAAVSLLTALRAL